MADWWIHEAEHCFQYHPSFQSSGTPKPHVIPEDLLESAPDGAWAKALPASLRERIDVCLSKAVLVSDRYEAAVALIVKIADRNRQAGVALAEDYLKAWAVPPRSADSRGNPQEAPPGRRRADCRHAHHDGKERRQPGEDDGGVPQTPDSAQERQAPGRRLRGVLQQRRGLSPEPHREGLRPGRSHGRRGLPADAPHDDRGPRLALAKDRIAEGIGHAADAVGNARNGPRRLPLGNRHDRPAGRETPGRLADPHARPARC